MPRMPAARLAMRTLCASILFAAVLVAWSPRALAAVDVTIQPPDDGAPVTISTDDIQGEVDDTYSVLQADGSSRSVVVENGVSLLQLLERADANFGYTAIEIQRPSGGALRLTREQVGEEPAPVIYTDPSGVSWLLGSSEEEGAVLAADHFKLGETLTLAQESQSKLTVTITPKKRKIDPGGTVAFQAGVRNGPAGATYTFDWNFQDGVRKTGPENRVTHKFKKRGEYRVLVTAKIDGTGRSDSAPVAVIVVGKPIESKKNRTGGGKNTDENAPDSGSSDGANGPAQNPSPVTPAPAPAPAPAPVKPKTPKAPKIATDPVGGALIEGNLLADASASPQKSILRSAARAAREGTLKKKSSTVESAGGGTPEAAISIGSVLLLVGLGAGMELRRTRPRML
jgi:plastocyanin